MKFNLVVKYVLVLAAFLCVERLSGQNTYSVEVGKTLTLDVPPARGAIDKAIWACSNPAISFVNKSSVSATIEVTKSFEGHATIELVYVERTVDYKGFTRANTYCKNFYVSCKSGIQGGGSSVAATSISIDPEVKVAVGGKARINYHLYPEGSTAKIFCSGNPGTYFNGMTVYDSGYLEGYARSAGMEEVKVYIYDKSGEEVSAKCKVTVYDPTWTEPRSVDTKDALLLTIGGEKKKIRPVFTPVTATALYELSSEDPSVVYKAWTGFLVAKSEGIADMKLNISNGLQASCTVVVLPRGTNIPGIERALDRTAAMLKDAYNINVK